MKKFLFSLLALVSILNASKGELTVSVVPQKYFVQKIVGDKFNVNVMVKPGFSPATYEPKTSQIKKLVNSKVYFYLEVPFEKSWLEKFKNVAKNTLFVDTAKGIEKIAMAKHTHHDEEAHHEHEEHHEHESHEHEDHDHDKDKKHEDHDEHDEHDEDHHGHHEHSGLDPHIWLDPIIVKTQAKNIYRTMKEIDPANAAFYKKNYKNFLNELDELDEKINDILKPYANKAFMVFHPAWGYFAKRYNLQQIAVEVEGKEPKLAQLKELIEEAKEHNIKIVFVSPQFSQQSAKEISKNIKGKTAIMNPLSQDWDKNLLDVAKQIANTYK